MEQPAPSAAPPPRFGGPCWAAAEVGLIFLLFCLFAGWPTPDVNEAHYLAKAKHFWNPAWCPGDFFLESADAHFVFYYTFGWLTRLLPLSAVAWVGRVLTWAALAAAWRRLSFALLPRAGYAVLTAALFLCFLSRGHMAGEWVVGGVEAKCFAYVFVLFGLAELVRGRWIRCWVLLGVGAAFHVLVGGWSVVAVALVWLDSRGARPRLVQMLPGLLLGGTISLAGLIPVLGLNLGADPETVRRATTIYVVERLDHHLLMHQFHRWYLARFAGMFVAWYALGYFVPAKGGPRLLRRFVLAALVIAATGALVESLTGGSTPLAAAWMRFYWYRLSDVALPLGLAVMVGDVIALLHRTRRRGVAWMVLTASVLVAGVSLVDHVLYSVWYRTGDPEHLNWHAKHNDWREVCSWIDAHLPADERFLTPRYQQTFKWYAGRSEVVTWKDVPQDAAGILGWHERFYDVFRTSSEIPGRRWRKSLTQMDIDKLRWLSEKYGFRYVLVDRTIRDVPGAHPQVEEVFRNDSFLVFRLREPAAEDRSSVNGPPADDRQPDESG